MKTLKAELFCRVGVVLLLAAVCNIVLAESWIKRGIEKNKLDLSSYLGEEEEKLERLAAFLLQFRMVREATQLDRIVYKLSSSEISARPLEEQAFSIASYDPEIAFVRVGSTKGDSVCIAIEDGILEPFSYLALPDGNLRVLLPGGAEGIAVPSKQGKGVYRVFSSPPEKILSENVGTEIVPGKDAVSVDSTVSELFEALTVRENLWIYKIELIETLLSKKEGESVPIGALKLFQGAGGYLRADSVLFSGTSESIRLVAESEGLLLAERKRQGVIDLDVVRNFLLPEGGIAEVGFSICRVLKEIAALGKKTILVRAPGVRIGFRPDGTRFEPGPEFFDSLLNNYVLSDIDFSLFSLEILTPKEEAFAVSSFLSRLGSDMAANISLSLTAASFFSFFLALLFLRKAASRITKPVTMLSEAARRLEVGHYDGVILPPLQERADEIGVLTRSFSSMVGALRDRDKIRAVLNKVVSKEISEEILRKNLDFTGEEKVVTVLFSDIRNFTRTVEGMEAKTLIPMLNTYFTRMCRIIDATRGVVDKFVGDEIMTLYGAPIDKDDHAISAVEAALLMMEDLAVWNEERKRQGLPIFEIGIGIHTGPVHVGNMGAENRLNYTAVGSNVNLASRICSVAGSGQILVSESTYAFPGVRDRFRFRTLHPVLLKGIENLVDVYEPVGRI